MVGVKLFKKAISVDKNFRKFCILLQVVGYRNKHENDFAVVSLHIISEKFTSHEKTFRQMFHEIFVYLSEI